MHSCILIDSWIHLIAYYIHFTRIKGAVFMPFLIINNFEGDHYLIEVICSSGTKHIPD